MALALANGLGDAARSWHLHWRARFAAGKASNRMHVALRDLRKILSESLCAK